MFDWSVYFVYVKMYIDVINPNPDREITEDEAKLYDRQIRLWGVNSQKMLRKANVLCIGCSGLSSEVIKNIGNYIIFI